jgi:hypothetical protein
MSASPIFNGYWLGYQPNGNERYAPSGPSNSPYFDACRVYFPLDMTLHKLGITALLIASFGAPAVFADVFDLQSYTVIPQVTLPLNASLISRGN